ncbi:type II toxin-antitoxin system HipA family toxin [Gluconobacter kondonii]|uniref:type II toxin-antitoxin system HipA family toxin n=1 Tax=Gluconobacter kondonii TaxID=941463 RepID=UPI001B8C4834|nr:type II toxin-antitoxin system HipA family toxin [Gluconobacter kondonii]MBS1081853.1 type II toxin-antitoxin system HipA family toxin [Gluconobacter kondonii]
MTKLAVLVAGKLCAYVTDAGGTQRLKYVECDQDGLPPATISLSMPVRQEGYGGGVVSNWLWNLLPDNAITLDWLAKDESRGFGKCSARNPLRLLEKIGEDCAGAVQLVPLESVDKLSPGSLTPLTVREVELKLRGLRTGQSPLGFLPSGDNGKFSLAGAQPKVALRMLQDETWAIPTGAEPTSHIFKPPIPDMPGQVEGEHFCLMLARATGLDTAQSWVMRFGDEVAIVVERFDRKLDASSGKLLRLHTEDICQALGKSPTEKYQSDGGPGMIEIVNLLRKTSITSEQDVFSFVMACVFNWAIGGTDAHAKNYSLFLGEKNAAALTPLYDLNTYLPYAEHPNRCNLSMIVSSHYSIGDIHLHHWDAMAARMGWEHDSLSDYVKNYINLMKELITPIAKDCIDNGLSKEAISFVTNAIDIRLTSLIESWNR